MSPESTDTPVSPEQIESAVIKIVKELSGREEVTPEMRLFEDLNFDALDVVECIMWMEEALSEFVTYTVFITDEDCDNCETVGDLIKVAENALFVSREFRK